MTTFCMFPPGMDPAFAPVPAPRMSNFSYSSEA